MLQVGDTSPSILQTQKHYEKLQEDLDNGAPAKIIATDVENLKGALSMLTLANNPDIPEEVKASASHLMSQMSQLQTPNDVTTYIEGIKQVMNEKENFL